MSTIIRVCLAHHCYLNEKGLCIKQWVLLDENGTCCDLAVQEPLPEPPK